jgi:putative protease
MELEVFVHGALCISYSGRCLLSGYFAQRDANQGTCANSCRWNYRLYQSALPDKGAGDYYLEEMERQGELMPISEDEHGTYILNSRDLCAIRHVERLIAIGVDSLKIEGRTKSHFYVARTTGVYRQAMDLVLSGQPFDEKLESALKGLANRGYTEGFLGGDHPSTMQNYETNRSQTGTERFVGEWVSLSDSGRMEIEVKNRFEAGDHLILITPQGEYPFQVKEIFDGAGHQTDVAPGSGHRVWVDAPVQKWTPCGLLVRVQKKCEIR